jgi:hypothetical protein
LRLMKYILVVLLPMGICIRSPKTSFVFMGMIGSCLLACGQKKAYIFRNSVGTFGAGVCSGLSFPRGSILLCGMRSGSSCIDG